MITTTYKRARYLLLIVSLVAILVATPLFMRHSMKAVSDSTLLTKHYVGSKDGDTSLL